MLIQMLFDDSCFKLLHCLPAEVAGPLSRIQGHASVKSGSTSQVCCQELKPLGSKMQEQAHARMGLAVFLPSR